MKTHPFLISNNDMKYFNPLLFLLFFINSYSQSMDDVSRVAIEFLENRDLSIKASDLVVSSYQENLKLVKFKNRTGWLLINSRMNTFPIMGYSLTNNFKTNPSLKNWGIGINNEIIQNRAPQRDVKFWVSVIKNRFTSLKNSKTVEPIINVNWDQGAGWNRYCPKADDGPDGRVYVGCVAVATAQAMSVYKYPNVGIGSHTHGTLVVDFSEQNYDWNNMSLSEPDNENSKLMYHLAVGLNMNFSASGSGSFTHDVPNLIKKHFLYEVDCEFVRRFTYEDDEWNELMKKELNNNRPLIYSGNDGDKAGHCFNIDGYDEMGMYHVNWGWSGSGNGYFSINNLSFNGSFNDNQGMVIGVKPLDHAPRNITLSNYEIEEKNENDALVATIIVLDYTPEDKHLFSIVNSSNEMFYVKNDSLFAKSGLDYNINSEYKIKLKVTDSENLSFEKDTIIKILKYDTPPNKIKSFGALKYSLSDNKQVFSLLDYYSDIDGTNLEFKMTKNTNSDIVGAYIKDDKLNMLFRNIGNDTIILNIESGRKAINDTLYITVDKETNLLNDKSSVFKLYPNPAIHSIKLSDIDTPTYYFIYNMNGVEIDKGKTTGNIDVENLPEGQYLLRIKLEKDITRTFIKK